MRVYQAFRPQIALSALEAGTFVPPFKRDRMTWIKPSFNWMMYRSGFATKHGQEMVLGIDITRKGFDWSLRHSVLTNFDPHCYSSEKEWRRLKLQMPVRIQWDPERDRRLRVIEGSRAIQIGLSGEAVRQYVDEWIVRIKDMTPIVQILRDQQSEVPRISHPDSDVRVYPVDLGLHHLSIAPWDLPKCQH